MTLGAFGLISPAATRRSYSARGISVLPTYALRAACDCVSVGSNCLLGSVILSVGKLAVIAAILSSGEVGLISLIVSLAICFPVAASRSASFKKRPLGANPRPAVGPTLGVSYTYPVFGS